MFKVKNKKDGRIIQVLDTYIDNLFGETFFLIWENDNWRWRPSHNYIPPNYKKEIELRGKRANICILDECSNLKKEEINNIIK